MNSLNRAGRDAIEEAESLASGTRKRWKIYTPDEIRHLRERLGMTQRQFAVALDLTYELVRSWEQNKRIPDQRTCLIFSLADYAPERFLDFIVEAEIDQRMKIDQQCRQGSMIKHNC